LTEVRGAGAGVTGESLTEAMGGGAERGCTSSGSVIIGAAREIGMLLPPRNVAIWARNSSFSRSRSTMRTWKTPANCDSGDSGFASATTWIRDEARGPSRSGGICPGEFDGCHSQRNTVVGAKN